MARDPDDPSQSVHSVRLTTADGHVLDADLAAAGGPARDHPAGMVVLCHPHPQYGGSRFDQVVTALFQSLPDRGFSVLRFDFRQAYGRGIDERLDVVAAIDAVTARSPAAPVHVVGYSFGAMVALGVGDDRIASRVLIAPPLALDDSAATGAGLVPPPGPTLVLVPEHDQFCPPDVATGIVDAWPLTTVETVTMADHFLAGRTAVVAELVGDWLAGSRHDRPGR